MRAILSDICNEAQVRSILGILNGPFWQDLWNTLTLQYLTLSNLGLAPDTPDSVIWHLCQTELLVLITANRNNAGSDSLEATIRAHNTATSLPVFTLADEQAILHSRSYAERVAEQLLDYLLDIDHCRGTGRLYLP